MQTLNKKNQEIFDTANKLIFVKEYKRALNMLDELLNNDAEARKNYLVHLRRIELGCQLAEASSLLERYQEDIRLSRLEPGIGPLCVAMIQQHAQLVPSSVSLKTYSDIILQHGETAAAYYGIALGLDIEGNKDRALFNYQQSLQQDPNWYPSYFGMSQIYYQRNDTSQGNHYFYLFEQQAPYTLYGNIETHRKLCAEYQERKQYNEAETAIRSLCEWWMDHRKFCPLKLRVLEALTLAQLAKERNNLQASTDYLNAVPQYMKTILESQTTESEDLHFLANILHEYDQVELCIQVYKTLLTRVAHDPSLVRKVGMQFLSLGELDHAIELFETAMEQHPDDSAIRFCLLSGRLKQANVDVENYLKKKDYLVQIFNQTPDYENILPLLRELNGIYGKDSDVHKMYGEAYLHLGNMELASSHFSKMYHLEPRSLQAKLFYASFLLDSGHLEEGYRMLKELAEHTLDDETLSTIQSLYSRYFEQKKDYDDAIARISLSLDNYPWNSDYLCQVIRCQMSALYGDGAPMESITHSKENVRLTREHFEEFDKNTRKLSDTHQNFLVYNRNKLRLLASGGKEPPSKDWIDSAVKFNPNKAAYECMKLLNTNFDTPNLYWILGVLFREAGSLEISEMWFEQLLAKASIPNELRLQARLDLSDSYNWRGVHLQKALAYLKIVKESSMELSQIAVLKMAHTYLRLGEVRSAREALESLKGMEESLELSYLRGLLHYRDGSITKAKTIWKPLLIIKATSIREHWIKKEILEFYFQGKSYISNA